eukprot:scaffold2011_cov233-Pinguiococcus_pyrenoidosus.AAC.4
MRSARRAPPFGGNQPRGGSSCHTEECEKANRLGNPPQKVIDDREDNEVQGDQDGHVHAERRKGHHRPPVERRHPETSDVLPGANELTMAFSEAWALAELDVGPSYRFLPK